MSTPMQESETMRHAFLVGERVYLRAIEPRDLKGPWFDWLNDYEVTRFLESGTFPNTPEGMRRYFRNVAQNPDNLMLAIVTKDANKHIGNIKLGPINRAHRFADLAVMIGDKASWGRGYAGEAWELVVAYGFERMGLHKITLGVYADHEAAVKLYQRLGFTIDGTLREHLFRDGCYHDKYVMSMLEDEYAARSSGKRLPGRPDGR